jgi:hypothetical protein
MCEAIAAPAVAPYPGTMLMTFYEKSQQGKHNARKKKNVFKTYLQEGILPHE